MNIHEYQAKELLSKYGVPVPKGKMAITTSDVKTALQNLGKAPWVIKAQIHAGGRGKAGGVKLVNTIEEGVIFAENLLGSTLVTPQTGPLGKVVQRLYVEEACDIDQEIYFSILVDRDQSRIVLVASSAGGMDIEEVADKTPEKIFRITIDPLVGLQPFHLRGLTASLELKGDTAKNAMRLFRGVYETFIKLDANLIEINPVFITKDGQVVAGDAKMSLEENSLYRHKELLELRDEHEEDPEEVKASHLGLNYVKLDGNIGCMVNGAGLAMATMDIIQLYGGNPANFLDVGGGASQEMVTNAFKIILSDKRVQAVLVNIFGGIMHCDVIAEGIIAAAKEIELTIPLVVRLEGTKVKEGKEILSKSGLEILLADNLGQAAEMAVKETQKAA
ncbi:MAG: ADP-forming succinate--CoA ligase subunit beta [Alphaproteobacteria bacterium]|jgi:succinyl-CoA synthetase beta subunit|nr:ADP-forming succinate--CoA ligase subunit beta [Alphaproteobacteria bacterium]MBT5390112.1 ADP-forming succinate--CoA ligase subunit beta [Alphaproteobacteria bacterium]MBT5654663.1 ADP-forming succinate--CoA ligase subunit beta [Alphaproteobacteria bacterium]